MDNKLVFFGIMIIVALMFFSNAYAYVYLTNSQAYPTAYSSYGNAYSAGYSPYSNYSYYPADSTTFALSTNNWSASYTRNDYGYGSGYSVYLSDSTGNYRYNRYPRNVYANTSPHADAWTYTAGNIVHSGYGSYGYPHYSDSYPYYNSYNSYNAYYAVPYGYYGSQAYTYSPSGAYTSNSPSSGTVTVSKNEDPYLGERPWLQEQNANKYLTKEEFESHYSTYLNESSEFGSGIAVEKEEERTVPNTYGPTRIEFAEEEQEEEEETQKEYPVYQGSISDLSLEPKDFTVTENGIAYMTFRLHNNSLDDFYVDSFYVNGSTEKIKVYADRHENFIDSKSYGEFTVKAIAEQGSFGQSITAKTKVYGHYKSGKTIGWGDLEQEFTVKAEGTPIAKVLLDLPEKAYSSLESFEFTATNLSQYNARIELIAVNGQLSETQFNLEPNQGINKKVTFTGMIPDSVIARAYVNSTMVSEKIVSVEKQEVSLMSYSDAEEAKEFSFTIKNDSKKKIKFKAFWKGYSEQEFEIESMKTKIFYMQVPSGKEMLKLKIKINNQEITRDVKVKAKENQGNFSASVEKALNYFKIKVFVKNNSPNAMKGKLKIQLPNETRIEGNHMIELAPNSEEIFEFNVYDLEESDLERIPVVLEKESGSIETVYTSYETKKSGVTAFLSFGQASSMIGIIVLASMLLFYVVFGRGNFQRTGSTKTFVYTNQKGQDYYLHRKGKLFFFAKDRKDGSANLPDQFTVIENEKTGLPMVKRKNINSS